MEGGGRKICAYKIKGKHCNTSQELTVINHFPPQQSFTPLAQIPPLEGHKYAFFMQY